MAESRQRAQALILAGAVRVDGTAVLKAGSTVGPNALVEVVRAGETYVSRGALKLMAALDAFDVPVVNRVAADVGASTGGFTQVLLRRGAARIYAIDVGYGQLAWALRQDPRVVPMERINIRHVDGLPEPIQLWTVDVSFISLRLVLPVLGPLSPVDADAIVLIKPQFEAGKQRVGKGGVIRDVAVHREVLRDTLVTASDLGWLPEGLISSPILGPAGNREFLTVLRRRRGGEPRACARVETVVERVLEEQMPARRS